MKLLQYQTKQRQKKIEVGGPQVLTLFEIAQRVYAKLGRSCLGIPLGLVKPGMRICALLGLFGVGKDQLASLTLDNTTKSRVASKYIELTSFDDWLKRAKL